MTESNPRSHLVETFIDSEFWRDTVGAELYAAILDQLKLAEQVEELRMTDNACPHCGTGSKIHPVNAAYCEAYETGRIATLESELQAAREENASLRKRLEEMTAELESSDAQNDALHEKMKALGYRPTDTCACSYERHEHVCIVHSPQLVAARERIQSLEHFAKANECHYGHYSEWVGAIAERDWEKARADKAEERIQSLEKDLENSRKA